MIKIKYLIIIFILYTNCLANESYKFVSTKSNEVNVHSGPGLDNQVIYKLIKKSEPLKVIREFEEWLLVEDILKESGWVHNAVVSNKRFIIITKPTYLYKQPLVSSKIIAKIMPEVRCAFCLCKKELCNIKCKKYKGWVLLEHLWGVN